MVDDIKHFKETPVIYPAIILILITFAYFYKKITTGQVTIKLIHYLIFTQSLVGAMYLLLPSSQVNVIWIFEMLVGLVVAFSILISRIQNSSKRGLLFTGLITTILLANLKMEVAFNSPQEAELLLNVTVASVVLCMVNFLYCYSLLLKYQLKAPSTGIPIALKTHIQVWAKYLIFVIPIILFYFYVGVFSLDKLMQSITSPVLILAVCLKSIFLVGFMEELKDRVFTYQIGMAYYQKFGSIFERKEFMQFLKLLCVLIFIVSHPFGQILYLPWLISSVIFSYLMFDVMERTNSVAYIAVFHGIFDIFYFLLSH